MEKFTDIHFLIDEYEDNTNRKNHYILLARQERQNLSNILNSVSGHLNERSKLAKETQGFDLPLTVKQHMSIEHSKGILLNPVFNVSV